MVVTDGSFVSNFYVEAMSEIMTGATDVMNAVADVTPDALTLRKVLAPIHEICSERTLEIVQLYTIDARMAAWERRALDQARRDPRDAAEVESDESLQMVDLFLDELSFIIRIIMGYGAFVQTICDGLDSANQSSGFGVKIQELNGVYLILERFYIFQSTHKATEIAEVQELESQVFVSSIVEDASFVLNKSFFRACQWCVH
jgi:conserved oligomeric Golgi complex subunit 4